MFQKFAVVFKLSTVFIPKFESEDPGCITKVLSENHFATC
jgi:hypothetical protein